MPKCKINISWLVELDPSGRKISDWCKTINGSKTYVFCNVCDCTVVCAQKGKQALLQHSQSKKHMQNVRIKLDPLQLHLAGSSGNNANTNNNEKSIVSLQKYSAHDSVINAELICNENCKLQYCRVSL